MILLAFEVLITDLDLFQYVMLLARLCGSKLDLFFCLLVEM